MFEFKNPSNIVITDVKIIPLKEGEIIGILEPAWFPGGTKTFRRGGGAFTQVHTNEGLIGIGPSIDQSFLAQVKNLVVGRSPFSVFEINSELRSNIFAPPYNGNAGLDIALWDIIGKSLSKPLYQLWGGSNRQIVPYSSFVVLSEPEERAVLATTLKEEGWKAIKLRIHHETIAKDIRTIEMVREAVGDSLKIMVDANQAESIEERPFGVQWDFQRALDTAKELENLNVYWLEEPLKRFDYEGLSRLGSLTTISLAGGENNREIKYFNHMLEKSIYDVIQPESLVMDGVTELLNLGELAKKFSKRIVPHHGGGELGLIAHMHLVAAWDHAPYLELLNDPPIGSYEHQLSILQDPPIVKEGYIQVPDSPGLGVEIDSNFIYS